MPTSRQRNHSATRSPVFSANNSNNNDHVENNSNNKNKNKTSTSNRQRKQSRPDSVTLINAPNTFHHLNYCNISNSSSSSQSQLVHHNNQNTKFNVSHNLQLDPRCDSNLSAQTTQNLKFHTNLTAAQQNLINQSSSSLPTCQNTSNLVNHANPAIHAKNTKVVGGKKNSYTTQTNTTQIPTSNLLKTPQSIQKSTRSITSMSVNGVLQNSLCQNCQTNLGKSLLNAEDLVQPDEYLAHSRYLLQRYKKFTHLSEIIFKDSKFMKVMEVGLGEEKNDYWGWIWGKFLASLWKILAKLGQEKNGKFRVKPCILISVIKLNPP